MFSQLLEREAYCDVLLACEGKTIKAHKIVLSACSTYFDTILSQYEEKDPILIMKDVKYVDIKCLVEFMYKGEINVDHCHLATLLKTAEELRIKGLAEVSWRDEECNSEANTNGIQSSVLPQVSTVMDSPKSTDQSNKRKRGRPPIDDYDQPSQTTQSPLTPKIVSVTGNAEDNYSNDAMSNSDQDLSIWEEDNVTNDIDDANESDEPPVKVKTEVLNLFSDNYYEVDNFNLVLTKMSATYKYCAVPMCKSSTVKTPDKKFITIPRDVTIRKKWFTAMRRDVPLSEKTTGYCCTDHFDNHDDDVIMEDIDPIAMGDIKSEPSLKILNSMVKSTTAPATATTTTTSTSNSTSSLTTAIEKEWPDVIKMNAYLNTGRRQQFWEEPFTKRVMDAIKSKDLEMKIAAELLGVSYGTLYGRYRDAYGCLKHPYRARDFWTEQGPTDILLKLKRKEITLFRAAEQLNVTPQILSNYLISMSVLDNEANQSSVHSNPSEIFDDQNSDDEADSILPDVPSNSKLFKMVTSATSHTSSSSSSSNSVLANCPDITIIKKEKLESPKVNNNSDHSDRLPGLSEQSQK
ncbi:btb domain transcription factor [Holotrichia oblita]|uniref:Btb domain transcription factor n=1 Tax=Holotrichia oblita TaxID=644536 RepID=A0ACB9STH3_HOLOL|nr:btb domain transcription factor [Holotrichia oblita]